MRNQASKKQHNKCLKEQRTSFEIFCNLFQNAHTLKSKVWENLIKCIWWMPWHKKTMKDVAACDKLRWGGKQPLTRRFPNGETYPDEVGMPAGWIYRPVRRWPGELKHLSSRRKRKNKRSLIKSRINFICIWLVILIPWVVASERGGA